MVTKNKPETLYGIQNFGIKKTKKYRYGNRNGNLVHLYVRRRLFICNSFLYATLFYTQLFFIRILKSYISNVNIFIIFFS